jgi:serine/threonine-protein kinase
MRCLEKRPADRPQSATEIVHALDAIITPSGGTAPHAVVTGAPNAIRRSRPRSLVAAGVVVAAILIGAFATWLSRRPDATTAPAAGTRSIAVLPFENEGRDTAMAFFADGMTDQLATALSQAGIRVAGRASVGAVQARGTSDAEAARILGVTMLLHGKVRRSGERLRVWAQLVNAKDGIALWTETYDTTLTDVFRVQDDVARLIVKELRPTLGPARVSASSQWARGTTDLQAYELFLKGRYYTDRLDGQRATEALTAAVARDPKYARAYAQLARAYASFAFLGVGSSDSIHALERDAAERAVQLEPTLAEAHAAMGATLVSEWRFAEAEAEFKRGLTLDPDNQDLNFEYCALLFDLGRASEALVQAERSLQHDPLSAGSIVLKQYTLIMMGRLDEARAATRAGLELNPTSVALYLNAGLTEAFGGRPDSALALLQKAYDLDPHLFGNAAGLLFGYAVAGRWEDVDRVRAEIERDGGGNSPNFFSAMIAVVNGDRDSAVTFVERGFAGREPLFLFVSAACDPMFDLIKSEPRFQALLERYGMRACPPFAKWPIPKRPT